MKDNSKRIRFALTLFSIFLAFHVTADTDVPTLERDVQHVFDNHCVHCHLTGGAMGNLVLEDGESYMNLVDEPSTESALLRVQPGNVDRSYLMHKLLGSHLEAGGSGMGMPLVESTYHPLAASELDLVRQWILTGAWED